MLTLDVMKIFLCDELLVVVQTMDVVGWPVKCYFFMQIDFNVSHLVADDLTTALRIASAWRVISWIFNLIPSILRLILQQCSGNLPKFLFFSISIIAISYCSLP